MKCPQCSSFLQPSTYEGAFIYSCNSCGGEFMGGETLAYIVRTRQERFSAALTEMLAERTPVFGVPDAETTRSLICPTCGEPMEVLNYAVDSGIFVDRCVGCEGIWLDHQELEKIQIIMEKWSTEAPQQLQAVSGKLEISRQKAAEKTPNAFAGSRFAFINALINRFLDAA